MPSNQTEGKNMKIFIKILAAVTFALTGSVALAHHGGGGGHGGCGHSSGSPGHFYGRTGGIFGYNYYPWGWYGYGPYYGPYDYPNSFHYGRDHSLATAVQSALAKRGFYTGPIDGDIGPLTHAAIRHYQAGHGFPVTGLIDQKLLHSLRLG
jgi:hypothetical protein